MMEATTALTRAALALVDLRRPFATPSGRWVPKARPIVSLRAAGHQVYFLYSF